MPVCTNADDLTPWPIIGTGGTALSANWLTVLRDQCADLPLRYRTSPPPPCTPSPSFTSVSSCSQALNSEPLLSLSQKAFLPPPTCIALQFFFPKWGLSVCCGKPDTEHWLRCSMLTPSLGEKQCQNGSISSLLFSSARLEFTLSLVYCKMTLLLSWNIKESFEKLESLNELSHFA